MYHKILEKDKAVWELHNIAIIDAIDKDERYHVGHPLVSEEDGPLYKKLSYKYAGVSLDKINYKCVDSRKFLLSFINIFYAYIIWIKILYPYGY